MTGSPLSATIKEVGEQPSKLRSLLSISVDRAAAGSIFVGAGDSYAAALVTFYLSGGKYLAFDPYAIFTIPSAAAGRDVIFISVSGRTNSNISAARRLRGVARRRIAITANQNSPLAEEVDDVILLPYESRARVAGTLSFTLVLLASMKVALGDFSCNFSRAYSAATVAQKKVALADHGTTYLLGNNAAHAIAVYGAAKVYEILGAKAGAEQLEEFSHMQLFSLKASDSVIIFSAFDP
ncbi:MAG TPA: SIS domain-containing protein, partial [Nitrososphaerales archaeon]|nr:SIS domain-containing protein [Nitrososphaerales archaeon]